MKLLVTGGAGYIGSHTCKLLAMMGHTPVVYDNLSTGHKEFVKWGDLYHGDIRDTQRLRSVLREQQPDGVLHFAASAYVGESVIVPEKYFDNNVGGTLSLLNAMRDEGIPNIVVSGTCAVYGQPVDDPISEKTRIAPINPYGHSKAFIEHMLESFHSAHGLRWMSLRYFNAAGGDPDGEIHEKHCPETHLIPRVLMAAFGRLPALEIYGNNHPTPDGTCIRDYVHVCDLAQAHIDAMEYLLAGKPGMPLNLGAGQGYSVHEIIRQCEMLTGRTIPFTIAPRRPGDPARLVADASAASGVLGWSATRSSMESMLTSALIPWTKGAFSQSAQWDLSNDALP